MHGTNAELGVGRNISALLVYGGVIINQASEKEQLHGSTVPR